jgi:uncharacterized protein YjeT (DUF2065 family)
MLTDNAANTPALFALFIGLYYAAAAIGGLTHPGHWAKMVDELGRSPYAQLVGGVMALVVGFALVTLIPPRGDWLNILLFAIGCLATIKGLFFLAMPERMLRLSRPFVAGAARPYAVIALVLGLLLCAAALTRFQ